MASDEKQRTVAREVWECAVLEAVGDAFARERLLPDASDHLRNVDVAAFRAAERHNERGVGAPVERLQADVAALIPQIRQLLHNLILRVVKRSNVDATTVSMRSFCSTRSTSTCILKLLDNKQ